MAQTDVLPDEMIESICDFADVNTLKRFMKTNSRMYKLCLLKFEEKGFKEQTANYVDNKSVKDMERLFEYLKETKPQVLIELLNEPIGEYEDDQQPTLVYLYNKLYDRKTNKKLIVEKMKLLIKYEADLDQLYNYLVYNYDSEDDYIVGDLLPELYRYAIDNKMMKKFQLNEVYFNEGWLRFYLNGLKLDIFKVNNKKQIIKSLKDEKEYIGVDEKDSKLMDEIINLLKK